MTQINLIYTKTLDLPYTIYFTIRFIFGHFIYKIVLKPTRYKNLVVKLKNPHLTLYKEQQPV